jgi:hypothetical protein
MYEIPVGSEPLSLPIAAMPYPVRLQKLGILADTIFATFITKVSPFSTTQMA